MKKLAAKITAAALAVALAGGLAPRGFLDDGLGSTIGVSAEAQTKAIGIGVYWQTGDSIDFGNNQ